MATDKSVTASVGQKVVFVDANEDEITGTVVESYADGRRLAIKLPDGSTQNNVEHESVSARPATFWKAAK